jgi:pyruvate/2-oxoglutarate dehydrogenase complex dihydrolipoamide dehydrogenase (E3) component
MIKGVLVMINIGVIGTGYVGLVQGVIMAEFGMNVICMDVISEKIEQLRNGVVPIYEPGLKELLDKNVAAGRLHFTSDIKETVEKSNVFFAREISSLGGADKILDSIKGRNGSVCIQRKNVKRQFCFTSSTTSVRLM